MKQQLVRESADARATPPTLQIRRTSLKEMAIQRIQKAIENEELQPGQQITELGLAHELGVAQTTVREVLIELEHQGFVEKLGPRNTRITSLTRSEIDDIYLVRRSLEVLAVELLARAAAPAIEDSRLAQLEMVRAAKASETVRFFHSDLEFHRGLWRATRNFCLVEALERIVPKLFAFGIIRHHRPSREQLLEIADLHGRLLTVIGNRDPETAGRLMEESMDQAWTDDLQELS